ncbi:dihydropteroate synthase, partial [Corynebacterium diphtheriae]|uniref:dihydropteroate synthase n=1 Tax=Corynebacterium diphtheriae TaxID=1717 RepID=UPI000F2B8C6F
MVTVFGILNLTEDSFFDESRRLDPAGAVTAAIEMLRVGSDGAVATWGGAKKAPFLLCDQRYVPVLSGRLEYPANNHCIRI